MTTARGTILCGPWTPATICEGMRPLRYHERRVERDTPVALTASSRVTQPSSMG